MLRMNEKEKAIALFNFSDCCQEVWIVEFEENYKDFFGKSKGKKSSKLTLKPYEYVWAVNK